MELSDKPLAITRRRSETSSRYLWITDIPAARIDFALRAARSRARVCEVSTWFAHTRIPGALRSSYPSFLPSFLPASAKERIPRSYETTAIFRYSSFLVRAFPSVFRFLFEEGEGRPQGFHARKRGRIAESFRHNTFYRWDPYIITVSYGEKRGVSKYLESTFVSRSFYSGLELVLSRTSRACHRALVRREHLHVCYSLFFLGDLTTS